MTFGGFISKGHPGREQESATGIDRRYGSQDRNIEQAICPKENDRLWKPEPAVYLKLTLGTAMP